MKKYKDFLNEEADLEGNAGVPEDWMGKTDTTAQADLGVSKDEPRDERSPSGLGEQGERVAREMGMVGNQIKGIINKAIGSSNKADVYKKMSNLAIEAVKEEFPGVFDNVKLDVQMVDPGRVADDFNFGEVEHEPIDNEEVADELMDKDREEREDDEDYDAGDAQEEILDMLADEDGSLKNEIDKAKLINSVTQGEGINTKTIIHGDVVRDGLSDIFGSDGPTLLRLCSKISELATKMNWVMSVDVTAGNLGMDPENVSGATNVEWEDDEDEEGGEEGGEDNEGEEKNAEGGKYVIMVRGVDLTMLIHELVKGMYLLLASSGLQSISDKNVKRATKLATSSHTDEAEDFRYGPYIAAELRDFINTCEGADKIDGVRIYVFGAMVQLPADEFLKLMLGIFDKTSEAKYTIEGIISDIIESFEAHRRGEVEHDLDNGPNIPGLDSSSDDEDGEFADGDDGENELDKIRAKADEPKGLEELSNKELQAKIDQLLDAGEYDKIPAIQKYMKENAKIAFEERAKKILGNKK